MALRKNSDVFSHVRKIANASKLGVTQNVTRALRQHEVIHLRSTAGRGKIEETLIGLAKFEKKRISAPIIAGNLIGKQLDNDEKIISVGKIAEGLLGTYPDSTLLMTLTVIGAAKSGEYERAHDLLVEKIDEIRGLRYGQKRKRVDKDRLGALLKLWRTLDLVIRNEMAWAREDGGVYGYEKISFLDELEADNAGNLDTQTVLFFAEPFLQGRSMEKYLVTCVRSWDAATTIQERMKSIAAMIRTGVRRAPDYHDGYNVGREYYEKTWSDIDGLITTVNQNFSVLPALANGRMRLLREALKLAREVGSPDQIEKLVTCIRNSLDGVNGKSVVWVASHALILHDIGAFRDLTIKYVKAHPAGPKVMTDITSFLMWATLAEEFQLACKVFEQFPSRVHRSQAGLNYANVLQRMNRFGAAEKAARTVLDLTLSKPHLLCPFKLWNTLRRVGELGFAQSSADLYRMVPQPKKPKGVIFVLARSLEQVRRTPLVVLMELKRQGWAVVPLTNGILPIEKTDIPAIDRYGGIISLDLHIAKNREDLVKPPEDFKVNLSKGQIKWRSMDFSQMVWEEASVNRRRYNIDYTCPALLKYVGQLEKTCEATAAVLTDLEENKELADMRAGFLIQFNNRLPDVVARFYCEKHGDPEKRFCIHSANGYQNYFNNFSTNVSTKCTIRNMTLHPETRTASFPVPEEFEAFYRKNKHMTAQILEEVEEVTRVKRSTLGANEMPLEARVALRYIEDWKAKGGKVACAFGKVVCDSGVPIDGGPAHKNMKEWLNHSIECVKDSNTLLLIKPHPHELNEQIACFLTETFEDLIEVEKNENVMLLGHRWFDIHMLNDMVDIGLIYNGTTAIEMGLMEIPCLLCGHYGPIDYPIGHMSPENKRHYRSLVRFEKDTVIADDLRERAAMWLYYMQGDKVMMDYRYNARQITNKFLYPSYWFEDDVEKYLQQGDENVTRLAQQAVQFEKIG